MRRQCRPLLSGAARLAAPAQQQPPKSEISTVGPKIQCSSHRARLTWSSRPGQVKGQRRGDREVTREATSARHARGEGGFHTDGVMGPRFEATAGR